MNEDIRLSKVGILLQQRKFAEAEKILKDLLATDANNIQYLATLAEVYLVQDKLDDATTVIDTAIGLSPDTPPLYYSKSRICLHQDKLAAAEKYITEAISLDAWDADYYALMGSIKLAKKEFESALEMADKALEIDAENLLALNTRSTALLKLNRSEESFSTIEGALREDPDNPYTHSNYGWGLLEKGDFKKAKEHFKMALSSDPNYEQAQFGMMESIKATNPAYRLFLKYAFWMGNLTSKYQWGVIIGFYFGMRALRSIAQNNEALQPWLTPIIIALSFLAFSTWVIEPISNLFLRFNKYGQYLLSKKEKMSSNFVGGSFALLVLGVLMYFLLSDQRYLTIAVFGFAMMVPFSAMFRPSKYKNALLVYAVIMAGIGLASIATTFSNGELVNGYSSIFILGFIGFQWVANFLSIEGR